MRNGDFLHEPCVRHGTVHILRPVSFKTALSGFAYLALNTALHGALPSRAEAACRVQGWILRGGRRGSLPPAATALHIHGATVNGLIFSLFKK